jgi:hypothetical protein
MIRFDNFNKEEAFMRVLIPYEEGIIAYFRESLGLADRATAKIRELIAYESRTEWRLDQYGWRVFLAICISVVSVALATVLMLDELGIGFSKQVVQGADVLIWVMYGGIHVLVIGETLWRYFRKPEVVLDRDAVLNAYQYFLKPFEDTLHKVIMISMIAIMVISERFIAGLAISIVFVAFLLIEHIAANRIREAIRKAG